jgi:hypothetical protein
MKLLCIKNKPTSVLKHILKQKNFPYSRRVSVRDGQRINLFVQHTNHTNHHFFIEQGNYISCNRESFFVRNAGW